MAEKEFRCQFCDYKTNKLYNLNRHKTIKHVENEQAGLIDIQTGKIDVQAGKIDLQAGKIDINRYCDKCDKVFTRTYGLNKHKEKCKGKINPLECNFCKKVFSLPSAKCRHQKICKEKDKPNESNANTIIQTQNNIENQNITNNITNNNITNNTINIIAFDPEEECNFVKTEAFTKHIKDLLMRYTNDIKLIQQYNRGLFMIKENQCVKKTNLRSVHSKVHLGEDKWQMMLDKNIYPKLVSDYANDFCNFILSHKRERHRSLERKLDCIADGGYINDEEEVQKKLAKDYNNLVHDLKLLAYETK